MKTNEFKPYPFLGIKNITAPLQRGIIWYGWLTTEGKSCTNASINFLNFDKSNLYTEGNVCAIDPIPTIEGKFEKDYIHILYDLSKRCIYGYLIYKKFGSEETIHNIIIWQTTCLLLLRGAEKKDTVSLGWPTTIYTQQNNYLLIVYWSNVNYDQNMQYWFSRNIYVFTTDHSSVYDITCKTLGHTHPEIDTEA